MSTSDWILNQFNGRASIVDGVFIATGDWEDLGWDTTKKDGKVISATLSESAWDPMRSFDVYVSSLEVYRGYYGQDVNLVLSSSGEGYAMAAAVVPEPETYAMLFAGLGLLVFVGRRREQNTAA